jgi:hypothetical protein
MPRTSTAPSSAPAEGSDRSITIIDGTVRSVPLTRATAAGEVIELDVESFCGARRVACTVVMASLCAAVGDDLAEGTPVLVIGTTSRRFFRSGGQTLSRTEVVASRVVAGHDRRMRNAGLDHASRLLDALRPAPGRSRTR